MVEALTFTTNLPVTQEGSLQLTEGVLARKQQVEELFFYSAGRIAMRQAFLKGHSPEDAEEVRQATLLSVWDKLENYDPEKGTLATWTRRIAHNKAVDLCRSNGIRLNHHLPLNDRADHIRGPSFEDKVIDNIFHQSLKEAVKTLRPEQQKVIELHFFQGFTHKEISEQTGIPLGTIKTRVRSGLAKLRERVPNPYL